MIIVLVYLGVALLKPLPEVKPNVVNLTTQNSTTVPVSWPSKGQAAIGLVNSPVLATHGDQTAVPTASTAKLMIALAVLKKHPLRPGQTDSPLITINQKDVDSYNDYVKVDGSVVPVNYGEKLSEYQALQALLLPSANNIAFTLANWAFGSVDSYLKYANQYAKELGLKSTNFDDASGFSPKTVSSAEDMMTLAKMVMKDPVLSKIVAQKSTPFPLAGEIYNSNFLLGTDGYVGIKTGNTDQAGGCYVFASNQLADGQQITIVGVIMGSEKLLTGMKDSQKLVSSSSKNLTVKTVISQSQTLAKYHLPWGPTVNAISSKDISSLTWQGQIPGLKTNAQPIRGPMPANTKIGNIEYKDLVSGKVISVPIIAQTNIPGPSIFWRLTHVF